MLCETVEKLIPQLLFNELDATEIANVQDHLSSCENCQKNYKELASATGLLQDALHADEPVLPDLKRAELLSAFNELETKNTPVKSNDIFPIPKKPENQLKVFFVCAAAFLLILIGLKMLIDASRGNLDSTPRSVFDMEGLAIKSYESGSPKEGKESNSIKEVDEKPQGVESNIDVVTSHDRSDIKNLNESGLKYRIASIDDKEKNVVRQLEIEEDDYYDGKSAEDGGYTKIKINEAFKAENERIARVGRRSKSFSEYNENSNKTNDARQSQADDGKVLGGMNRGELGEMQDLPKQARDKGVIIPEEDSKFTLNTGSQSDSANNKTKNTVDFWFLNFPNEESNSKLNKNVLKNSGGIPAESASDLKEGYTWVDKNKNKSRTSDQDYNVDGVFDRSLTLNNFKPEENIKNTFGFPPNIQQSINEKQSKVENKNGQKIEIRTYDEAEPSALAKPIRANSWSITLDSRVPGSGTPSTNPSMPGVTLSNVRFTDGNVVSSDAVLSFGNGTDVTVSATASNNQVNNDTSKTTVAESRENQKAEVTGFTCSMHDAYSTFSMDAGSASYDLSRQIIATGRMPAPGVVRPEEFVNAFDYQYVNNTNRTFSIITDCMPNPIKNDMHILRVGIKGKVLGRDGRKPLHLIFVIDTSGSMGKDNRLPYVKKGLVQMMSKLQLNDRISLVTYGSEARVQLEYIAVDNRQTILSAIDSLKSAGPTHLSQGVSTGYELAKNHFNAKASNQVILCSDGVANIGDTDGDLLLEQVAKNKKLGISFSCVGFGSGDYNDKLIEKLSHSGDGFYYYVNSEADLKKVFVDDIGSGFKLIARDAKIQIEFDPASVYRYRLIGYEKRMLAAADFRNDEVDGGEIESGRSVTAFYEIELVKADKGAKASVSLGKVNIRYQNIDSGDFEEDYAAITSKSAEVFAINDNPYFYLGFSAVLFSEILRASPYINTDDIDKLEGYVSTLNSVLPQNMQIKDFLNIIKVYQKNRPR